MIPRAYIAVNGIHTIPGCSRNWNRRFCYRVNTEQPGQHIAIAFEYFTSVFRRSSGHAQRVKELAKIISELPPDYWRTMCVIAHSNGAAVAIDALLALKIPIGRLLLIAPAISRDCVESGLARVSCAQLWIWRGTEDKAMILAGLHVGRAFGFGDAGTAGVKLRNAPTHLECLDFRGYGHESWFEDRNWENTYLKATA